MSVNKTREMAKEYVTVTKMETPEVCFLQWEVLSYGPIAALWNAIAEIKEKEGIGQLCMC